MNETLEEMARALFKSWFVDFDPVRAKMEGRKPAGMDDATAALFPDSFEESELGEIPKGWEVGTLKERAINIQYGFTQSAKENPVGPQFLRITDIRGGSIDWGKVPYCLASDDEQAKYMIKDGDIFVARTGASTGENVYVTDPPKSVFASYLVRFQFESRGVARFVGQFMRSPLYFDYVAGCLGGSAQPNASAQTLGAVQVAFPSEGVADANYETIHVWDKCRSANARQSMNLAQLRDTLLPKLLSGELDVSKVEKQLGNAI